MVAIKVYWFSPWPVTWAWGVHELFCSPLTVIHLNWVGTRIWLALLLHPSDRLWDSESDSVWAKVESHLGLKAKYEVNHNELHTFRIRLVITGSGVACSWMKPLLSRWRVLVCDIWYSCSHLQLSVPCQSCDSVQAKREASKSSNESTERAATQHSTTNRAF